MGVDFLVYKYLSFLIYFFAFLTPKPTLFIMSLISYVCVQQILIYVYLDVSKFTFIMHFLMYIHVASCKMYKYCLSLSMHYFFLCVMANLHNNLFHFNDFIMLRPDIYFSSCLYVVMLPIVVYINHLYIKSQHFCV